VRQGVQGKFGNPSMGGSILTTIFILAGSVARMSATLTLHDTNGQSPPGLTTNAKWGLLHDVTTLPSTYSHQQQVPRRSIDFLKCFSQFAMHHGVDYQLGFGSLLGQVRNKSLIPWDADVDLMVSVSDQWRIEELWSPYLTSEGKSVESCQSMPMFTFWVPSGWDPQSNATSADQLFGRMFKDSSKNASDNQMTYTLYIADPPELAVGAATHGSEGWQVNHGFDIFAYKHINNGEYLQWVDPDQAHVNPVPSHLKANATDGPVSQVVAEAQEQWTSFWSAGPVRKAAHQLMSLQPGGILNTRTEYMLPTQPCIIEGIESRCPPHPEHVLQQLYGPDWRTPHFKHWSEGDQQWVS